MIHDNNNHRVKRSALLPWAVAGVTACAAWQLFRRAHTFSMKDKVVMITGGSRGLGLVMARQLVEEGANVIILARDDGELGRAFDDLTSAGGRVMAIPCDVTEREQAEAAVKATLARWGRIDVLINNAGIITVGPVDAMTLEDYEQAMQTHFWGPLYMIQAVLPSMRQQRTGRIVNISSVGGRIAVPHLLPYSASKFALVGLSEGLRAELAQDGIVVTTVCPGLMRTGSPRHGTFKGQNRAEYAWFSNSDSLPLLTMSAQNSARQIIDACKRGDGEIILSWPAKLGVLMHDLFPDLTADMLALVNRLMPGPGETGKIPFKGKDSQSSVSPSLVTSLNEKAARENNEMDSHPWEQSVSSLPDLA